MAKTAEDFAREAVADNDALASTDGKVRPVGLTSADEARAAADRIRFEVEVERPDAVRSGGSPSRTVRTRLCGPPSSTTTKSSGWISSNPDQVVARRQTHPVRDSIVSSGAGTGECKVGRASTPSPLRRPAPRDPQN